MNACNQCGNPKPELRIFAKKMFWYICVGCSSGLGNGMPTPELAAVEWNERNPVTLDSETLDHFQSREIASGTSA